MDWRLLLSGLVVEAASLISFPFLWNLALQRNSILLLSSSIVLVATFLVVGVLLATYGLFHRGTVDDNQAGVLFLGSLALGIVSVVFGVSISRGYYDDLAACGGFPPGVLWSQSSTVLTRCDVFYRVPFFPMLGWMGMMGFGVASIMFVASLVAARRNSIAV